MTIKIDKKEILEGVFDKIVNYGYNPTGIKEAWKNLKRNISPGPQGQYNTNEHATNEWYPYVDLREKFDPDNIQNHIKNGVPYTSPNSEDYFASIGE